MRYVVARAYSQEQQNAGRAHAGLCHAYSYISKVVNLSRPQMEKNRGKLAAENNTMICCLISSVTP